MGNPVVDLALEALYKEGFPAVQAGSEGTAPDIHSPVAAVSIRSADWPQQTVTLAVSILCPAALGAVRCQSEALRAGAILTQAGARCSQGKCTYDGLSRLYQAEVLAEYTGLVQDGAFVSGPDFILDLDGMPMPHAISFRAELTRQIQTQYVPGNTEPVALISGEQYWRVELTELLPPGIGETTEETERFSLTVNRCGVTEVYGGCRWQGEKREFTLRGLQRTRTGICTHREVTSHG